MSDALPPPTREPERLSESERRSALAGLYRKATRSQWIGDELAWSTPVDPSRPWMPERLFPLADSSLGRRLTRGETERLRAEICSYTVSQLLHGELGALTATAQLVVTLPDHEGRLFVASQVVDEARHAEVFERYLRDKVGASYAISPELDQLLRTVLDDSRWDVKVLGVHVVLEGLALASLGSLRHMITDEPLLAEITRYVLRDEARHVGFAVLALRDFIAGLGPAERSEREDLVFELTRLMRDRLLFEAVWERCGLPVQAALDATRQSAMQLGYRRLLFSRIVTMLQRIDLFSSVLRERFAGLGVLRAPRNARS